MPNDTNGIDLGLEASNYRLTKENEELAKQVAWFRDAVSILGFDCPAGDAVNPLKEQLQQLIELRNAIDDECLTSWISPNWDKPRETLKRLLDWHVKVALDPRVSRDAADLIEKGPGWSFHNAMLQYRCMEADAIEAERNEQQLAETDSETVSFKPTFVELEEVPEALS